jgi:hypothetical protein
MTVLPAENNGVLLDMRERCHFFPMQILQIQATSKRTEWNKSKCPTRYVA